MGGSSADQRSSGLSLEQAVPEGSAIQRCNSPHAVGCRTDRENEQVHRGALPLSECLGPTLQARSLFVCSCKGSSQPLHCPCVASEALGCDRLPSTSTARLSIPSDPSLPCSRQPTASEPVVHRSWSAGSYSQPYS